MGKDKMIDVWDEQLEPVSASNGLCSQNMKTLKRSIGDRQTILQCRRDWHKLSTSWQNFTIFTKTF